jgi:hypothetical protein
MSYRNKTYVAFASEDIKKYWLMEAWRENQNIEFDFFDAHDLFVARDTSKPETIKANLRERMKNAKQFILLGSADAKRKGGDGTSFLAYEVETMIKLGLPIVVANLDGDRKIDKNFIPKPLLDDDYHMMCVSFQPKIIKYALDNYAVAFSSSDKSGCWQYKASVYEELGL